MAADRGWQSRHLAHRPPQPTATALTIGLAGIYLANLNVVRIGTGNQVNIQNQSAGTTDLVYDAAAYIL